LHGVNVVAAAAIAGTGLDATHLKFFNRKPGARRYFNIHIESTVGNYFMSSSPNLSPDTGATSVVAASVVTALVQAQQTIWAG
jgi:aspartate dehydrogenase